MVSVLVSYAIEVLCDKSKHPQTQWYTTAFILTVMSLQGSCGLVSWKVAQVGDSITVWGLASPKSRLWVGFRSALCVFFFFWGLRQMRQYLPRVCSSHSSPRIVGGQDKLEAYIKLLFVSYLLLSPWPRQVIWPNPMSMGQESKLHPQRKEKGSEYLLNRPNSQRIQEFAFSYTSYYG